MHSNEPHPGRWLAAAALAAACAAAQAHEPVAKCHVLDASSIRCRGASNHGDEMPGARMEVLALDGRVLVAGRLAADSTLTFSKPAQPFYVLFDIGPGLQVTVEQGEITVPPPGRVPRWMRGP